MLKKETVKLVRRLIFILLMPLAFITGTVLAEKIYDIDNIYIGLSLGVK